MWLHQERHAQTGKEQALILKTGWHLNPGQRNTQESNVQYKRRHRAVSQTHHRVSCMIGQWLTGGLETLSWWGVPWWVFSAAAPGAQSGTTPTTHSRAGTQFDVLEGYFSPGNHWSNILFYMAIWHQHVWEAPQPKCFTDYWIWKLKKRKRGNYWKAGLWHKASQTGEEWV